MTGRGAEAGGRVREQLWAELGTGWHSRLFYPPPSHRIFLIFPFEGSRVELDGRGEEPRSAKWASELYQEGWEREVPEPAPKPRCDLTPRALLGNRVVQPPSQP